jgi:trehalose 6-phosphate synthase
MNLVAKEYVAAQNPEDPGVLILSRFAGAALECKPALLVNPYDTASVGSAIARALSMPLEERRARQDALFRIISQNDITDWPDRFLSMLTGETEPSRDHVALQDAAPKDSSAQPYRPIGNPRALPRT